MKEIMRRYLSAFTVKIVLEMAIKLISTLCELALPMILSHIIDNVIAVSSIRMVIMWGGIMLLCSVTACATHILTNRMSAEISGKAVEAMRSDTFSKITHMSEKQLDKITIPSLVSRVTEDSYILYNTFISMQRAGVRAPIMLCGAIIFMLIMDPVLTLVLLMVTPFAAIITYRATKRCMPMYQELQRRVDAYSGKVREIIQGIRTVKAFAQEDNEVRSFCEKNHAAAEMEQSVGMAMAKVAPVLNVSFQLCLVLVLLIGGLRINCGALRPADIVAFLTYVTLILTALTNVSKIVLLFSKAGASSKRILEVLDAEIRQQVITETEKVSSEYILEFENVCFSYESGSTQEKRADTVTDINFKLKKGQQLGIIGGTGSGKSTLIQLMLGFNDTSSGTVRLNGQDVKDMEKNKVKEYFAPVFQYDYVCRDTIENNIRFGRQIPDADVYRAAQTSQALEFIIEKQNGFKEFIESDGKNLSGGQKQRLLIARALAGRPQILILDDSFSALDYETGRLLKKAMRENYKELTSVIVSQRVQTIKDADIILVMDKGKIVGAGTHNELLTRCSVYQEICSPGGIDE